MTPQERAAEVRNLMAKCSSGILSTHSERMDGYPYGSVAPFAVDADGAPVFFFSNMAVHSKNLKRNGKASLLIHESAEGLEGGRVNLFGEISPVTTGGDLTRIRPIYLAKHPESAQWIDFGDFHFYRMTITSIYWVGGFGNMGWTTAEAYQSCFST